MIIQGKVWGTTTPLFCKNNVELHYVEIKKGGYCSKHLHKSKYNRFFVMKGLLQVTIWKNYGSETLEDISIIKEGQECTVSPGDFHKFVALEDTIALEIYWVELSESDIKREDHGGMLDEKTTDLPSEKFSRKSTSASSPCYNLFAGETLHGKRYDGDIIGTD